MQIYEKKIIGGILAGRVASSALSLDSTDFTNPDLGLAFITARKMEMEGREISPESVYSRIIETGNDSGFYAQSDYRQMCDLSPSAAVVYEAEEKVKAVALKAFLKERIATISMKENQSGAELLRQISDLVAQAEKRTASGASNFVGISNIAPKLEGIYRDFHEGVSYAEPTYFPKIDDKLNDGYSKGDLHVTVGFTGSGKTALALNCARNQAQRGIVVGFVSREMSAEENLMRLQAADAGIPRGQMRKDIFDGTYRKLVQHLEAFKDLPIFFDTVTTDVESLRPQVQKMVEEKGLQILYIDYIQLLTSSESHATRANEVQKVSRTLKQIAMENNIPVVALCQFNRSAVNASVFDLLNHLKESSGIEQDASTILYVQIEKMLEPTETKDAAVTILKNRNGSTFEPIDLVYRGDLFTFTEK